MANAEHLEILKQGKDVWNQWRKENRETQADLSGADLRGANLRGANLVGAELRRAYLGGANLYRADLHEADLRGANLIGADLRRADLRWADLTRADLTRANLIEADLGEADLTEANLRWAALYRANLYRAYLGEADLSDADLTRANLYRADLRRADLSRADLRRADLDGAILDEADLSDADLTEADLSGADLVETNFEGATLRGCHIFGISAWKLKLEGATQADLIISAGDEPVITVDNLEVAQFMYLLLNNKRVRDIIDTITTKVVLILGRFTPERKAILDAIREELRRQNYVAVMFDFDKPASRDFTETVRTLAYLARFIIADITDPRSVPQELQAIVPDLEVPVQAIIQDTVNQETQQPWSMFEDFQKYDWVLGEHRYRDLDDLLTSLRDKVIGPAEAKAKELQRRRERRRV